MMKKAAPDIDFVDSGAAAARQIAEACGEGKESGAVHCYVSDTPANFNKTANVFLGEEIDFDVERVDIEKY
jgi:glutamate racemase